MLLVELRMMKGIVEKLDLLRLYSKVEVESQSSVREYILLVDLMMSHLRLEREIVPRFLPGEPELENEVMSRERRTDGEKEGKKKGRKRAEEEGRRRGTG